ncbi:hypothetical protein C1I98_39035, partial [Spongiactinospora gelatinilytica]
AEGFGQVEFDHDLLVRPAESATQSAAAPEISSVPLPLAPEDDGHATARVFERAAWRAEIHRACERIRGDRRARSAITPAGVTTTQLNALREVVSDLPYDSSDDRAANRLAWLTRKEESWPPEAVQPLHALITDPDRVWELLALDHDRLVVTTDGATALRAELRGEAIWVLVTACLAGHARDEAVQAEEGERM